MRRKFLFFAFLVCILISCKPTPPPTYTVSGRILNGTTMMPLFINQPIQLEVTTSIQYGTPVDNAILGSCTVDDSGKFSFTYSQTNITDKGAYIRVDVGLTFYGNFPVNQNVNNQNIYLSTLGSLKIYLRTQTPLKKSDTLFLAYTIGSKVHFDTITNTIIGLYKAIRTPPPYSNLFWGRGANNFIYNANSNGFIKIGGKENANITGDPIIDSVTINY